MNVVLLSYNKNYSYVFVSSSFDFLETKNPSKKLYIMGTTNTIEFHPMPKKSDERNYE